ncbi:MAG TPA: hypothetical protein VIY48_13800 [Candidatus Paceibacterota bacterium]
MKLLVLGKNDNGETIVLSSSETNLTDNTQLSLISVGDKIPVLVDDEDAHVVGDVFKPVV